MSTPQLSTILEVWLLNVSCTDYKAENGTAGNSHKVGAFPCKPQHMAPAQLAPQLVRYYWHRQEAWHSLTHLGRVADILQGLRSQSRADAVGDARLPVGQPWSNLGALLGPLKGQSY